MYVDVEPHGDESRYFGVDPIPETDPPIFHSQQQMAELRASVEGVQELQDTNSSMDPQKKLKMKKNTTIANQKW